MSYPPPFNHSREDSPLHPCEECAAAMSGQIARQNQLLQLILGFATTPAADVPLSRCGAPALEHRLDSIREMITAELRGQPQTAVDAPAAQSTELQDLQDQVVYLKGQVSFLEDKLDATHTNRCFHCERTVTEETSKRQRTEPMKISPVFVRFPHWRWWFVFWPPAMKRHRADVAKFAAACGSVDQQADVSVIALTEASGRQHQLRRGTDR